MCSVRAEVGVLSGKRIGIATLQLLDRKSRQVISPERWLYAVELSRLLIERGDRVEWWQLGDGWRTELLPGVTLWGSLSGEAQFHTFPTVSEAFHEQSGGVDGVIYFDPILAYPLARDASIAIDHGVQWDDPTFEPSLRSEAAREEWRRRAWSAYMAPRRVVATDTHVIQWATATWPSLHHRFVYIPNFVPQPEVSRQSTASPADDRPLRLLFPSALAPSEGVSVAIQAMEELLETEPDAYQCYLSGGGAPEVQRFVAEWARRTGAHYDPRPLRESLLAEVDVVIFPAKSRQGTSMRCLQAMAAGKVVVVAQTGGLTDIVLHDHNGLIIPPNRERLVRVLRELRQQPERRQRLGMNARRVAAASFSLERWRERWSRLIEETFG